MGLYHLLLATCNHVMLCEDTLILGMVRWFFAWVVGLVKEINAGLFFHLMSLSDHLKEHAPPSNFSLEIARDNLILTTFGETNSAKRQVKTERRDTPCAVCLKRLRSSEQVWELSNCSHVFHRECLERWLHFDARMTCPLCRASLITLNENTRPPTSASEATPSLSQPSWAVEQLLYFFGDDLPIRSSSCSS